MPTNHSASARVILRDAATGRWLEFSQLRRLVQARTLAEVAAALGRVEEAVTRDGLYAAGFVSYEAAPAFDNTLPVNADSAFPLLWFGLFESAKPVALPASAPKAEAASMDWQPSLRQTDFEQAVAQIKALIRSGDTYQVNYTYRLAAPFTGDPWPLFLRLVAAQDPPYGAFVDTGDWVICSASPELFFRLDGDRIQSRPMKGTAARGRTHAEDLAQAQALQASEKERAENVMIVDMVRHDLGRIAQTGTVNVARLFELEKYPTIWQMTSTVEARTKAGLADIFRALFPPASITGAPKVRTMQIIADLEPLPRRLYTGTIGFLAPGRRAQFNVAIRTLLANRKTACAEYGVGSGITWDSNPAAEWRECIAKAAILSVPVPAFSLLETMRWTPAEGFFLLDRHLERLQDSADYFGFPLDLPALRLELDRLASRLVRAAGVRPSSGAAMPASSARGQPCSVVDGSKPAAPDDEAIPAPSASPAPTTCARIRLLVSGQGQFILETEPLPAPDASGSYHHFQPASEPGLLQSRRAFPPLHKGEGRGEGEQTIRPFQPHPISTGGASALRLPRVALARAPVDSFDAFLYHKTTNRAVYEAARAACPGFDDVILFNEKGEITESTIANIAVDIDGRLCTPPVSCGLLPGTLRADLLEQGELAERRITPEELLQSPRVLLFNSVRGMYRVEVVKAEQH